LGQGTRFGAATLSWFALRMPRLLGVVRRFGTGTALLLARSLQLPGQGSQGSQPWIYGFFLCLVRARIGSGGRLERQVGFDGEQW
jgi:hypothetical protein